MKAGVIGAGAWGTALAQLLAANGQAVRLWALEAEVVDAVNGSQENPLYLPGIPLSPSIAATGAMADMADCDLLLVVSPAQHLRSVVAQAPAGVPLLLCSKGIEAGTSLLMSEVAQQAQPRSPIAVLSGPTFAHEVARGLPTAITLACEDRALGERLAARIARPAFRPYLSDDVIGAEIGGAVKNVLAIACGVAEGAGLGLNARAALISRGFAEMTRFGLARGARAETLGGLSGLGDLVLTCTSAQSRNFRFGQALGRGETFDAGVTVEGAATAKAVSILAQKHQIELPIAAMVAALVDQKITVEAAVSALMSRPLKEE